MTAESLRAKSPATTHVGVATDTDGDTAFVEFDADGEQHGRKLVCTAGGATVYVRCEHGSWKEGAALRADGTCLYGGDSDSDACRADY